MFRWLGILALGFAAVLAFFVVATSKAHARDYNISITREVPTVLGIRDPVYPAEFNRAGPRIMYRPGAAISELDEPAPANGCEDRGGGFRELSGPARGRCSGGVRPLD